MPLKQADLVDIARHTCRQQLTGGAERQERPPGALDREGFWPGMLQAAAPAAGEAPDEVGQETSDIGKGTTGEAAEDPTGDEDPATPEATEIHPSMRPFDRPDPAAMRAHIEAVHEEGSLFFIVWKTGRGRKSTTRAKPFVAGAGATIDGFQVGGTDAAVAWALRRAQGGWDVYLTTGTFVHPHREGIDEKTGRRYMAAFRRSVNAATLHTLTADVDIGKEDGYPTHGAARAALSRALAEAGLPEPTFIVRSGSGGLHAWWLLDAALSEPEWRQLAKKFADLLVACGLKFDSGCTSNAAGILRLAGSGHFKDAGNPHPVYVSEVSAHLLSTAALREIIEEQIGPIPPPERTHDAGAWEPAAQEPVRHLCRQFAASLATGGEHDHYPLWYALLSNCNHIEGGRELAHELSCGWDGYDPAVVDKKLDEAGSPQGCRDFEAARAGPCQACPSRGTIVLPLQLDTSRRRRLTPVQERVWEEAKDCFLETVGGHGPRLALSKTLGQVLLLAPDDAAAIVGKLLWLAAGRGAAAYELSAVARRFLDEDEAERLALKALDATRETEHA